MKLIPLDAEGKPLISINKTVDFNKRAQKHQGNFGLLTGSKNNLIAVEITNPELNVYPYYFTPSSVICPETNDPDDVLKGHAKGYILYRHNNINFETIDFTEYLFGFRLLGNGNYTQYQGSSSDGSMYINHNLDENGLKPFDLDKLLAKKESYDKDIRNYDIFYKKTDPNWNVFYSRYIKNLRSISGTYWSNNEDAIVSSGGLFRIQHAIGYPHYFMKHYQNKKDEWYDVKKYCGSQVLTMNDENMIIERPDGYYTVKLYGSHKEVQTTNWTGSIESINKLDSMEFQMTTHSMRTGQPVTHSFYVNDKMFVSSYMIKKVFAKYGLLFFTKSDPLIYLIFNCLLERCKTRINTFQDTFKF